MPTADSAANSDRRGARVSSGRWNRCDSQRSAKIRSLSGALVALGPEDSSTKMEIEGALKQAKAQESAPYRPRCQSWCSLRVARLEQAFAAMENHGVGYWLLPQKRKHNSEPEKPSTSVERAKKRIEQFDIKRSRRPTPDPSCRVRGPTAREARDTHCAARARAKLMDAMQEDLEVTQVRRRSRRRVLSDDVFSRRCGLLNLNPLASRQVVLVPGFRWGGSMIAVANLTMGARSYHQEVWWWKWHPTWSTPQQLSCRSSASVVDVWSSICSLARQGEHLTPWSVIWRTSSIPDNPGCMSLRHPSAPELPIPFSPFMPNPEQEPTQSQDHPSCFASRSSSSSRTGRQCAAVLASPLGDPTFEKNNPCHATNVQTPERAARCQECRATPPLAIRDVMPHLGLSLLGTLFHVVTRCPVSGHVVGL